MKARKSIDSIELLSPLLRRSQYQPEIKYIKHYSNVKPSYII